MDLLLQSNAALDQDRSTLQLIIIALLVVAALLGVLTVWYWKQTKPAASNSTIVGAARYGDTGYDEYDDGFREQPEIYANDQYAHDDGHGWHASHDDRRRPVVRRGDDQRPAQSVSDDDAWAAMTGASDNEPDRY